MTNEERNLLSSDPYPGLRPYHEDEQDKFFGRDADAEVLIDKVLTNRLTLLFAASGVGKSSLLQAAVIPRLKSPTGENLEVVYHIDWVSEPVSSVRAAVLQALHSSGKLPEGAADEAGETLAELLEFCGLFVRHPLVLILDQFEEFFRYQRASANFQPFIEQLTAIITNPQLPVSLVLSMREDFALELNAFKPRLPTILFENFYRLEKLGRVGAREAIVTPVEQVGFRYEPVLLEILLDDLLSRELDRLPNSPAAELLETVEPPYLQIVCAQLWDLNRADPDKLLRLVTYEKAGKAKGILSNYLKGVLQGFSLTEKQLASKAFDHLASQRGVKMAYTAAALAETVRESEAALGKVLDKLAAVRILRTQQRGEATWYELYHDIFSGSIESWNGEWKDRMRRRKFAQVAAASFISIAALFAGWDYYVNASNYHLRLSPKQGISDRVELWQGKPGSFDLFHQQRYLAETDFERNQLEPDKQFDQKSVADYNELQTELIGKLPIEDRVAVYADSGSFDDAVKLAEQSITPERSDLAKRTLPELGRINVPNAARLTYRLLIDDVTQKTYSHVFYSDSLISDAPSYGIGVFLIQDSTLAKSDLIESIPEFWRGQLLKQGASRSAREQLIKLPPPQYQYSRYGIQLTFELWQFSDLADLHRLLLNLLKDQNPSIRSDAVGMCATWQVKESIPNLLDLLKDQNAAVRSSAASALGSMKVRESIPILLGLLKEQNADVRSSAAIALGEMQVKESIPVLLDFLKNQDDSITSSLVASKLRSMQVKALIPNLLDLLKDQNAAVRSSAASALGSMQVRESIPILLGLLKDQDSNVRSSAASALGSMQVRESVPILLDLLKDQDADVRRAAASALMRIQSKESIPVLLNLLKDQNAKVRSVAASALEWVQVKESIPILLSLLKDQDADVRSVAIRILKTRRIKKFLLLSENNASSILAVGDSLLVSPFHLLRRLKYLDTNTLQDLIHSDELNDVQKRLCQKALAQIDSQTVAKAREALEKEKAEHLPINQPVTEDKSLTLAELQAKLNGFDDAYADWRNRRDATPESDSEKVNLDNPALFIFEYAYSIAGVDEDEGIKLLGHNLQEVRDAAANSLARSTFLGVPLLQRLEKEWLTTDNPITRQSLFHAIDLVLLALEKTKDKDLEALKAYEAALSDARSIASIKPRVEWTRVQLEWRLNALKELKELAEERMPSLLKDYCMNPDGTDIEGCTITR